ncbi:MAG: helix-turn-helix transcriptional regulator [Chloroflexales bacterium]|nr:helix-turn-helix transcriptional regulator [Chloroflexales bacterium]
MTDERPSSINEAEIAAAVGHRIAEARVAAGLTLRSLAARLGVDHSTLAGYEAGRRPLRVTQLILIARALNMSPAAMLIDPPEAAAVVNQLEGNLERALQVSYILDTLELPGPEPQP